MNKECDVLLQAVRQAGQSILDIQQIGYSISRKENEDVLTEADLSANQILKNSLTENFPDYGWLSEENIDDESRWRCSRVWIIDPIDGTREFIAEVPEFTVSAALVEKGEPILACVFNPSRDELFHAVKGGGVFLNQRAVHCRDAVEKPLELLASRSEFRRGEWGKFKDQRVRPVGSIAYKLALLAAGEADATFSLGPKNEWDIAAGVLLVTEAGGIAKNRRGESFRFNQHNTRVDGIVAATLKAEKAVWELINTG